MKRGTLKKALCFDRQLLEHGIFVSIYECPACSNKRKSGTRPKNFLSLAFSAHDRLPICALEQSALVQMIMMQVCQTGPLAKDHYTPYTLCVVCLMVKRLAALL
jgi:hypothetical protein